MAYEKIVLVTRKTRLEGLIERFNTRAQARFYIEHSGGNFVLFEREHETYYAALTELRRNLKKLTKLQLIEREFLPNFIFTRKDLIVTLGIDGLVVNTAKYLDGQPIVAVNPDPANIDGILLPFSVPQAAAIVQQALDEQLQVRAITMAQISLNDGQSLLAFNDLFIGVRTHTSARYSIEFDGKKERHSSSGLIVATGAGSTGWLSSMFNMANGMLAALGEDGPQLERPNLDWETERLMFVVREPFISKTSGASIVFGEITADVPLILQSEMAEEGVIFSDGTQGDYIEFNAGAIATVKLAERKTNLVVS